ncbi:MAG: hypothetical protein IT292_01365 [Deltaproteobacteria bacterium]|nr:hypothetical protein [Deltaproteobacteria bacterium]
MVATNENKKNKKTEGKTVIIGFIIIFTLLLILPMAQRRYRFIPPRPVTNVYIEKKFPKYKWEHFKTGKFQKLFENYFLQTGGLWGILLASNNSIDYTLFREISTRDAGAVLVGKDYALYESMYVNDYNGRSLKTVNELRQQTESIKRLQDFMAAHGKAVLVLVSANKAALYPEWIPDRFKVGKPQMRNIDVLRKLYQEAGVNFIDSAQLLKGQAGKYEYRFYAPSAAHWNSVASCLVAKELMTRAETLINKKFKTIVCGTEIEVRDHPAGTDRDLANLINVWNPSLSYAPTPYMTVHSETNAEAYDPKMLFVGTSFLWSIFDVLEKQDIYTQRDFYYYASTNHYRYRLENGNVKKGSYRLVYRKMDFIKNLLQQDIIVLEINEARIHQLGFTFLKVADKRFSQL